MNEPKYFLDSNIFLRPIVKDDVQKVNECKVLFGQLKQGRIRAVTSSLVLAEILWVCKKFYNIKKEHLVRVLKRILEFQYLKIIDEFDALSALELYGKYNVKFIDALIASIPKISEKKTIIVSYDQDFDKLKIIRKEPGQIIDKPKN